MDAIHEEIKPEVAAPIIQVENLTVCQGSYVAIQQVSFELLAGTDTAIVGPNGAGKSTLVQAILGLIPFVSGTVSVFGRPLNRLGKLRHSIGYIPQNFIFERNFPISVAELISLGWVDQAQSTLILPWKRSPVKTAAIAQALERVGAAHLAQRSIGKLSGGELKRVLLAYCLVSPRRLLILDEAFAGVDVQGETDFYALLNQLKQEQHWTVLQISHDLDMVSQNCDRVLCLNRSLICHGRPETALSDENLLHAYGPAFSRYQHRH